MADNKGFEKSMFFSIEEIFEKLKKRYRISKIDKNEKLAIIRKLQRDLKRLEPNPQKGNKRTNYYSNQTVEAYIDNPKTFRYFRNRFKDARYKPNDLLIAEQKEELEKQEKAIYALWEEVSLAQEEGISDYNMHAITIKRNQKNRYSDFLNQNAC